MLKFFYCIPKRDRTTYKYLKLYIYIMLKFFYCIPKRDRTTYKYL